MLYSHTIKLVRFYKGVDGLKTGFTEGAGYCLTSTASKNGMRLITVVMGSDTAQIRNAETTEMLDYGFAQYKVDTVLSKNKKLGKIKVLNGYDKYSNVYVKDDITFLNKKGKSIKDITYKLKLNKVKAPIKTGDKVGSAIIYKNKKKIKEIDLTVINENEKLNILDLYIRNLINILLGE